MGEVVIDSQLEDVDFAEFLDKLGELYPETLTPILAHLD